MMTLQQLLPNQPLPAALLNAKVQQLTLDSRQVTAGSVFCAMPGHDNDGRRFIKQAIQQNATAVLAEADGLQPDSAQYACLVPVAGLRQQLGELAARFYGTQKDHSQLFAVTGTNGKTSVAWFLRDALNAIAGESALIGTLGMQFAAKQDSLGRTTPDVLNLHRVLAEFRQAGADNAVMEVSSHALDQGRVDGLPIEVAIFTNLSRDHLDYHGSMAAYFEAKAKLFTRDDIKLVALNQDDASGRQLVERLGDKVTCITYGHDEQAIIHPVAIQTTAQGMQLTLQVGEAMVQAELPLFGDFNISNVMAVAAVLRGLGYDAAAIKRGLAAITPVPGRMQPVKADKGPTVLVDYAHTPDGLEKALSAVTAHFDGATWCLVGCGGDRDTGKRPQMAAVAERLADHLVLTSDNPRSEDPAEILRQMRLGLTHADQAEQIIDRQQAIAETIAKAQSGDVVLIAGKGHETTQEINGRFIPMDDRQLAANALATWQPLAGGVA